MVVLSEEFHGLTLKRKGADEPELFDDRSGFPLSCRATKMRRLACPDDGLHHQGAPAVGGVVTTAGQEDVPMGDAPAPAPSPGAGGEDERAMVVYGDAARSVPRLRPWATLRAGADWVRAMLREADSRTVRELLASAQQQGAGLALAVVPWVAPPPAAEEAEPYTAEEAADGGDSEGAAGAAMDVEEGEEQGRRWAGQTYGSGEGLVYRWPQHCMAPPQLPAVAQASPVMWSW